jgi:hypothetical protein
MLSCAVAQMVNPRLINITTAARRISPPQLCISQFISVRRLTLAVTCILQPIGAVIHRVL